MKLVEIFVMKEAKCPACGIRGAYHGARNVECPNPDCRHYDSNTNPNVNEPGSNKDGKRRRWAIWSVYENEAYGPTFHEVIASSPEEAAKLGGLDQYVTDLEIVETSNGNYSVNEESSVIDLSVPNNEKNLTKEIEEWWTHAGGSSSGPKNKNVLPWSKMFKPKWSRFWEK